MTTEEMDQVKREPQANRFLVMFIISNILSLSYFKKKKSIFRENLGKYRNVQIDLYVWYQIPSGTADLPKLCIDTTKLV